MKRTQIVKFTITVMVGVSLFTGCNKKSNVSNGKNQNSYSSEDNIVLENNELNLSKDDEQEREFALANDVPESDFNFELTEDYEGVTITKYKGNGKSIVIPSEIQGLPVIEIGKEAFSFTNVVTVVIPDSVQKLGDNAFNYCKNLKNIKFSKAITSIPEYCFYNCESLSYFIIPENITYIGGNAFSGTSLETIDIPDRVKFFYYNDLYEWDTWSSSVFSLCKKLKNVRFPENLTQLPTSMFYGCESLESIILPESITEIGEYAFRDCKSLTKLDIPSSVTTIGKGAFSGTKITNLYIPNSVTKLECSFFNCKELTELHLPDSLTIISDDLFHSYDPTDSKIRKINIPASIKVIEYNAFTDMKNMTEIIIPDSITEIEWRTFDGKSCAFLGCSEIPLVTQKKLKQLGYNGQFTY